MVIDEEAVLSVAQTNDFNIEYFRDYLKYQTEKRQEFPGKWAFEEYVAVRVTQEPDIDFFTNEWLEWFGNWMGFGGKDFIPDSLNFLRYCMNRDLHPYNETRTTTNLRVLKKKKIN